MSDISLIKPNLEEQSEQALINLMSTTSSIKPNLDPLKNQS